MKTKTKTKIAKKSLFKRLSKKLRFYIMLFCALVISLGVISLANFTIGTINKTVTFLKDPLPIILGDYESKFVLNAKRGETIKKDWKVIEEYQGVVTAYNAGDPNQCDNSPCLSANGENICTAIALGFERCATNKYKFGTKLLIDDKFLCTVTDRMNERYQNGEVDIAMPAEKKKEAIAYGAKKHNIKVVE